MVLELMRQNRAMGKLHGTGLSLTQSHLLTELALQPTAGVGSLADTLELDQSSVSRCIDRLEQLGLLKSADSPRDRRRLSLKITAKGKRAMQAIDRAADQIIEDRVRSLSHNELLRLIEFHARLSDCFEVSAVKARPSEHRLRSEQRRLTRAFRLLSEHEPTPTMPDSERMLLALLEERLQPLRASQIAAELGLHRSAVSTMLKKLMSRGDINSLKNPNDSRGELYTLSSCGQRSLSQAESRILRSIEKALKSFTAHQQVELLAVFKLYAGYPTKVDFEKRFSLNQLRTRSDCDIARGFYLRRAYESGLIDHVPARLFDGKSPAFSLMQNGEIKSVLQIVHGCHSSAIDAFASALPLHDFRFENVFVSVVSRRLKQPFLQLLRN